MGLHHHDPLRSFLTQDTGKNLERIAGDAPAYANWQSAALLLSYIRDEDTICLL